MNAVCKTINLLGLSLLSVSLAGCASDASELDDAADETSDSSDAVTGNLISNGRFEDSAPLANVSHDSLRKLGVWACYAGEDGNDWDAKRYCARRQEPGGWLPYQGYKVLLSGGTNEASTLTQLVSARPKQAYLLKFSVDLIRTEKPIDPKDRVFVDFLDADRKVIAAGKNRVDVKVDVKQSNGYYESRTVNKLHVISPPGTAYARVTFYSPEPTPVVKGDMYWGLRYDNVALTKE